MKFLKQIIRYTYRCFTQLMVFSFKLGVTVAIILLVLNFFLMPTLTQSNDGLTIPDVTQMELNEAITLLDSYGLRYMIGDRRSSSMLPSNYVLDQRPLPGEIVKPHRRVVLTVNTAVIPMVVVPNIERMSLRNARIQLENRGLKVGTISFQSARFRNTIIKQSVASDENVPKGTVVDIVVSDGLGSRFVTIPEIIGMTLDNARVLLLKNGLDIGSVTYQPRADIPPETILAYTPNKVQVVEGTILTVLVADSPSGKEGNEETSVVQDSSSNINFPVMSDTTSQQ